MPEENSPIICIGKGMTNLSLQEQALHEELLSQRRAVPLGAGGRVPHGLGGGWPLPVGSAAPEYHPEDLVVTVPASLRIHELESMLGAHRQWSALTLPDHGQDSLGGVIALALEGWFRSPLFRDRILGLRVLTPAFGSITTGAKVVKSVAGYNLPRLFLGSRGALGVITEVTLRVSPRPPVQRVWVQDVMSPETSLDALRSTGIAWASLGFLRQSGRLLLTAVLTGHDTDDTLAHPLGPPAATPLPPRLDPPAEGWLTYGSVPISRALALLRGWPPEQPLFLELTTGGFWGYVTDAAEAHLVRQCAAEMGGLASTPFLRPSSAPPPWWKTLKKSFDPDGCLWDPWE